MIVALYTVASRCERPVDARAACWVALPITAGVIANTGINPARVLPKLALTELRRLLGVIRAEENRAAFMPQPGVGHLGELIEQVRDTGLPVELAVEGNERELPDAVGLCAYRIVQETLTNTLKHADASAAQVSLRYGSDVLELSVVDNGYGALAANGAGDGHGIIGMRERVALFGGELAAGRDPAGGLPGDCEPSAGTGQRMSIRVLICDDQALVRGGFRAILESKPDIEVVGEAENGAQAVALAERRRPDVILIDVRMPIPDGVEATRRILAGPTATRILVLRMFDLDE